MAISSRAIKAGEAFVSMMLDDEEFSDSIDRWKTKFSQIEKTVAPLGKAMAGIGATMSAPFALGFRHLLTYTKQLSFTASRLGLTADEMARLAAVAQMTDVSVEGLEIGMKTIGERIMQLQSNSAETAEAFKQLGIDAQQFINEPNTLRRLFMISEAFTKIEDAGLQAGLSLRALGESGNRMLILLRKGPGGIAREMEAFADIVADESQMQAAENLFQGWGKLKIAAGNLSAEMAETMVPILTEAMDSMTALAAETTKLVKRFPGLTSLAGQAAFAILGFGTALLAFKGASYLAFSAVTALKSGIDILGATLGRVIPLFVQANVGMNGMSVAATTLSKALGVIGLSLAAAAGPFMAITGITEPLKVVLGLVSGIPIAMSEVLEYFNLLPQSVINARNAFVRWLTDTEYDFARPVAGGTEEPKVLQGPTLGGLGTTSSIAARFASQQTIGASATVSSADQTATNTGRLVELQAENNRLLREAGKL